MAKKVDITEKLSFDGNPVLVIKGVELEVNADAPTMLKIMGLMSKDDPSMSEIMETYNLMFPEKSRQKIENMKLNFQDIIVVIQEGVALIAGEEVQGE